MVGKSRNGRSERTESLCACATILRLPRPTDPRELLVRAVTGVLFVTQPMARLLGRVRHGLTPWRRQRYRRLSLPFPRQLTVWDEEWRAPAARLSLLEARAERLCKQVARGGGHDRWDIDARSGLFAGARVRMGVEEHGQGRQLVRFRVWPVYSRRLVPLLAGPAAALVLGVRYDFVTGEFAAVLTMLVIVRALHEAAAGVAAIVHAATDPDDYARHRPAETRSTGHVALDRLTVPAVEESA